MEDVRTEGGSQAGFTLAETLIAMLILIVGLMAVANLFAVAGSTNTLAKGSTGATSTAMSVMEMLRASPYLDQGGDSDSGVRDAGGDLTMEYPVLPTHVTCDVAKPGDGGCVEEVPGVGRVHVHWLVTPDPGERRLAAIRVRAQVVGAMMGARSRVELTTLVVCSDTNAGTNRCGM